LNTLAGKIRGEIADRGAIPFARFMELALFCPDTGYYERDDDTIGRRGDFFTSVSVGPVFGGLIGFQFSEWMAQAYDESAPAGGCLLVEAGAHDGQLAKDILTWLRQQRPELFGRTEYWIVEPSVRRRRWQAERLGEFVPRVRWVDSLEALRQVALQRPGVIFANELLDAMPVHRFGWDALQARWFEWGVAWKDGRFQWARLPESRWLERLAPAVPAELLDVLPDGFAMEACPAAESWWGAAAGVLRRGKLLTFDYGFIDGDLFAPHRTQGTLRAYHNHRVSEDVLANPGGQDITAQVNFPAIVAAGEAAGLRTECVSSQAQFLTGIAERFWREPERNGAWTARQTREFQTLVHPEHLGRAFRVLVQSR
jgi:SAM-dependent MidA family methyltransferase